jgi:Carboxypeptidase regulatory-like domain
MANRFSLVAALALAVLAGTISDRTTGQPMPGVTVTLGAVHATSKADGSYRLAGVKPGHATLTVSSDDVPPQHLPVTIGTAATSRADLRVCSTTLDYNCGIPQ